MAVVKEIQNGKSTIRIMDDYATKDPKKVQEIVDQVSRIVIGFYKRETA